MKKIKKDLKKNSDLYQEQYIQSFVSRWDQLIDWDARARSEGTFFIDTLRDYGAKRVLDVATGTGFHSVRLLNAGFDVVSADGNPEMLTTAFHNARQYKQLLTTVHADWRWLGRTINSRFDAIICLGNSFTHLFSENDRRKALAEFYSILKHDGILILDQRNYDCLLDKSCTGKKKRHYYCGDNVEVYPEYVDEKLARFCYRFPDQSKFHLNMFPLRRSYTCNLLMEVGFQSVQTFGDFQETYPEEDHPDFFIHVAEKKYRKKPKQHETKNIG
ncbi:glycine/sarcosine N-methyltransferase [Magnetococcales bacterium HHB-1]